MKRSIIQGFAAIATSSSSITCKYSQPLLVEELQIRISDGNVLAAKRWTESYDGNPKSSRLHTILCLHGWLDNCASFHHLAPVLASKLKATQVVAMDFPGHGHSSHKGLEAPPMVQSEMVYYVCEAIEALLKSGGSESNTKDSKYQRITLVGHSLGAGVASLTTAAFPEYVETLVLLDAASFLARRAEDTALHVRDHVARRLNHEPFRESRIYRSLDLAVKVRRQAAKKMPGKQSLSYKAAKELVQRGTRSSGDDGELQYRHDFRFTWPSIQYMTWEQNEGIFISIRNNSNDIKTCVLTATDGWPFELYQAKRLKELMRPKIFQTLPGSHYFHSDPDTADLVAETILDFLQGEI